MKKLINLCVLLLVTCLATTLSAAPSFHDVTGELVKKNEEGSVITGVEGWLFFKEELVHIGAGSFWGEDAAAASRSKKKSFADPLPAILEYNGLLAEKGITLYLMPVPPKALVYPDKLVAGVDRSVASEDHALYQEFFGILEKEGVKTIDMLPVLMAHRDKADVYCKTDTHFSGYGLSLFAETAANVLKQEPWYESVPKTEYVQTPQKLTITGDLAQMAGENDLKEELELTVVNLKGSGEPVASDEKSPVILMGDSHTLVFSAGGDLHAKGAGLFDHLSAGLGFPVDLLGVRGSGVTPARINLFQRSKKDGEYLEGKKALIWCFTARDFTGTGGWRKIPVAP